MFNKAYIGFKAVSDKKYKFIHTGEWCTGAFGNNPLIMYYLQLLAFNAVNNKELKLIYYLHDDKIDKEYNQWYIKIANTLFKQNVEANLTINEHLQFLFLLDKKLDEQIVYLPIDNILRMNVYTDEGNRFSMKDAIKKCMSH